MSFQHVFPKRLGWTVVAAGLGVWGACSWPDDESDQVVVVISGIEFVLRGEREMLTAKAMRVNGSDTAVLQNVVFAWTTANPEVATVQDMGSGRAEVTGVNVDTVGIRAWPVAFEKADARPFTMRVSDPVVVDSVRPDTVSWGEQVTVFGIGVDDPLFEARLGLEVQLIRVPYSAQRDNVSGLAQASYWVPYGAHSDSLLYFSAGRFGKAPGLTEVVERDLYEPNDAVRWDFEFASQRPFPQAPSIWLLNPALAFERLNVGDSVASDWYRYHSSIPPPTDLTFILAAPTTAGTMTTFLTDSLAYSGVQGTYLIGPDAWTIGPGQHACHGLRWSPPQQLPDSVIIALGNVPPDRFGGMTLDYLARNTRPGPYGLAIFEEYRVTDPGIAPRDAHEEDDFCSAADAGAKRVTLPFRDTLTIDNPLDVDWIRFTVSAAGSLRLRSAAVGPPPAVADSGRDIDLYLIKVPAPSDFALQVAASQRAGTNEDLVVVIPAPSDYYAVVVDKTGVPTAYDLCIGNCATFPASAVTAAASRAVRRLERHSTALSSSAATAGRSPSARP